MYGSDLFMLDTHKAMGVHAGWLSFTGLESSAAVYIFFTHSTVFLNKNTLRDQLLVSNRFVAG